MSWYNEGTSVPLSRKVGLSHPVGNASLNQITRKQALRNYCPNMYTVPGVALKINFSAGVSGNWRKLRNSVRPWLFHKKMFSKLVLHNKSNALTVYKGTYVLY